MKIEEEFFEVLISHMINADANLSDQFRYLAERRSTAIKKIVFCTSCQLGTLFAPVHHRQTQKPSSYNKIERIKDRIEWTVRSGHGHALIEFEGLALSAAAIAYPTKIWRNKGTTLHVLAFVEEGTC